MEQILEVLNSIGSLLTGGGLGVLTFLFFYDSRKRTEAAKAKLAEAYQQHAEGGDFSINKYHSLLSFVHSFV